MATTERSSATSLYDVDNVEGFVRAAVAQTKLRLDADERDELIAEGALILYRLAERYEHHRAGYSQPGSFAGYASSILPNRLVDAWHRLRQHSYVVGPDGNRAWNQGPRSVSLDEMVERGAGETMAGRRDPEPDVEPFEERLRRALRDEFETKVALCSHVAMMRADGMPPNAIAAELGIPTRDVRNAERWLARALERL